MREIDKDDMYQSIWDFPENIIDAIELSENITLKNEYVDVNNIIIAGMGGSAIGGDVVYSLVGDEIKIPYFVIRGETEDTINILQKTGKQLGVAFQIQDDLFEIFGDEARMGKSLGSDILSNKNTAVAIESRKHFKSEWNIIVQEFGGKNLDIIRSFLVENEIKNRIEEIAEKQFLSAYHSLAKLGFDKHSELQKFIKIIQERHS